MKTEKTKLKDNIVFRSIIIPICICLCFFFKYIPNSVGLSESAMGVIGIFIGVLILWLTIGICWPSLLCIFSLFFIKDLSVKQVFENSFGNEIFIFLIFTFACTYALSKTLIIKRIALWFVTNKLAKKGGWWLVILFFTSVLFLGMFISPTVLFVVCLPIVKKIIEIANIQKGEKVGKMLLLGLGFSVSISSGMTPIAHVFPIIAMNMAHLKISYVEYMGFGIPIGILCFIAMILIFKFILRPDISKLRNINVSIVKAEMPKISKKEIICLSIFCLVILLWIIPSLFKEVSPSFYNAINRYGTAMPPIAGTILLCIIRVEKKPLIEINDAFKNGIPWASLLMCASTLALGNALLSDAIGLKLFIQTSLSKSLVGLNIWVLVTVFTIWTMLQTNLSSNMITATLVASVAAAIISSTEIKNLTAIIWIIGLASAFAFSTPPSMPHIAIVAGDDYCDTKTVLIYGSILMLISTVIIIGIGYPLALCLATTI